MESSRNNIEISGAGTIASGVYGDIDIAGAGSCHGDIDCDRLDVAGSAKVNGNLKSKKVDIAGSAKVLGDLETEKLDVAGTLKVNGNTQGYEVENAGVLKIMGNLKAHKVDSAGLLSVAGNVDAETLSICGSIKTLGMITAEHVTLEIQGVSSEVQEIGGVSICIKPLKRIPSVLANLFKAFSRKHMITGLSIEADYIEVSHSKFEAIKGDIVKIGPECIIDLVEYSDQYDVHETAQVKSVQKV